MNAHEGILLEGMSGIEASRWIKEQKPDIKILLVSSDVKKELLSVGINVVLMDTCLKILMPIRFSKR